VSSLIFLTTEDFAFIATDTLATSPEDGRPFKFSTKAFPIPHLKMIISCTGIGGFGLQWFIQVNDNIVVPDVERLNFHTPNALRKLWADFNNQQVIPNGQTVTIYHFGFSKLDNHIHSYAYRSTNNFTSESIIYGIGTKPPIDHPEQFELPKDLRKMMEIQRAAELSKPTNERVGIGGEIQTFLLNKDGFIISTIDKFDNYDSDERTIYSKFNQ
jgi:hypothetical protein